MMMAEKYRCAVRLAISVKEMMSNRTASETGMMRDDAVGFVRVGDTI